MGIFEDGIVFDHTKSGLLLFQRRKPPSQKLKSYSKNQQTPEEHSVYTQPTVNTSKEDFEKAVEKAKEYVTAGDIFQVVLSKRFQFQYTGSL